MINVHRMTNIPAEEVRAIPWQLIGRPCECCTSHSRYISWWSRRRQRHAAPPQPRTSCRPVQTQSACSRADLDPLGSTDSIPYWGTYNRLCRTFVRDRLRNSQSCERLSQHTASTIGPLTCYLTVDRCLFPPNIEANKVQVKYIWSQPSGSDTSTGGSRSRTSWRDRGIGEAYSESLKVVVPSSSELTRPIRLDAI